MPTSSETRIVQDSDDELDDEDLEADLPPSNTTNQSSKPSTTHSSATPQPGKQGTGSTESLVRLIHAAHRDHLQAQPVPPASLQPLGHDCAASSASQLDHRDKRRKITVDEDVGLVTYAGSRPPQSSPCVEFEQLSTRTGLENSKSHPQNSIGEVHDRSSQPLPAATFPEPSSTVPNATLTQQRLLEQVAPPAFLGLEGDSNWTPYQPAKSSVHWSDFIRITQSDNSQNRSDSTTEREEASYHSDHAPSIRVSGAEHRFAQESVQTAQQSCPNKLDSSQHHRYDSSGLQQDGPLQNEVPPTNTDLIEVVGPPSVPHMNQASSMHDVISNGLDAGKKPNQAAQTSSQGQRGHSRTPALNSTPPIQEKPSSIHNSDDELGAVGLPKEQYKPRPSRSRSLKMIQDEQIDYSVRPEKAASRRAKRKKSGNEMNNLSQPATPQKVQQICDMGFTPSTTQRGLMQNGGDVSQTVDWLIAKGLGDDELAPSRSSKRKTMDRNNESDKQVRTEESQHLDIYSPQKPRKASTIDEKADTNCSETTEVAPVSNMMIASETKSPKVQVVIPTKQREQDPTVVAENSLGSALSPRPKAVNSPGNKIRRRKTTLDQPESASEQLFPAESNQVKKRGRGRPRKDQSVATPAKTVPEEAETHQQHGRNGEMILNRTNASKPTESCEDVKENEPVQGPSQIPAPQNPPPKSASEISQSPEKQPVTNSTAHSPLNKSRVSYRVGLSKRARIAPLLRTVKK